LEHSKIITAIIVVTLTVSLVVATNEFCLWAKEKVENDELAIQAQFGSCMEQIQTQVAADLNLLNQSLTTAANQLSNVDLQSSEADNILNQLSQQHYIVIPQSVMLTTENGKLTQPAKQHPRHDISYKPNTNLSPT
jgi:hypothetical protein